jgi:hypothetical protein
MPPVVVAPSNVISNPLCVYSAYTAGPPLLYQFNNEQRQRINMAEDLVKFLHYPHTETVATGVSMGAFSLSSPLDARDIYNLQRAKGYSPHYLAGHFKQKSMSPSVTPPAPSPGHTICFDIRKLKVSSINGYTHSIQIVSEFEGYIAIRAVLSCSRHLDVFSKSSFVIFYLSRKCRFFILSWCDIWTPFRNPVSLFFFIYVVFPSCH